MIKSLVLHIYMSASYCGLFNKKYKKGNKGRFEVFIINWETTSSSLQKVLLRALVDWMKCGFGQFSALVESKPVRKVKS